MERSQADDRSGSLHLCEQHHAGLVGAGPAEGKTAGEEVETAEGLIGG